MGWGAVGHRRILGLKHSKRKRTRQFGYGKRIVAREKPLRVRRLYRGQQRARSESARQPSRGDHQLTRYRMEWDPLDGNRKRTHKPNARNLC